MTIYNLLDNNSTKADIYSSDYILNRLDIQYTLQGHGGCVNALSFDDSGDYLLSGSDDRTIMVWHSTGGEYKRLHRLSTSHRGNIFACRFLSTNEIVSCAADGSVLYTNIEACVRGEVNEVYRCHTDMAMEVLKDPLNERCFMSCSSDGTVNLYDLRVDNKCRCLGCNRHLYIDVNSGFRYSYEREKIERKSKSSSWTRLGPANPVFMFFRMTSELSLMAMAHHPTRPLIACGCSDGMVRTYDRRFLTKPVETDEYPGRASYKAKVYEFAPSHIRYAIMSKEEDEASITSIQYYPGGDLLVSYADGYIYRVLPSNIKKEEWDGVTELSRNVEPYPVKPPKKLVKVASSTNTMDLPLYDPQFRRDYDKDILRLFKGHRNRQTMIKEARYFSDNVVMSGSDDGHLFLWKNDNEKPYLILKADGNVVNCIALHPDSPLLAVSGIDDTIKIIEPGGGLGSEYLLGKSELLTVETAKEVYKRAAEKLVEMLVLSEMNEEEDDELDESGSNALGRLLGGLSGQVQIPDELKQRLIVWDYNL